MVDWSRPDNLILLYVLVTSVGLFLGIYFAGYLYDNTEVGRFLGENNGVMGTRFYVLLIEGAVLAFVGLPASIPPSGIGPGEGLGWVPKPGIRPKESRFAYRLGETLAASGVSLIIAAFLISYFYL